MHPSQGEKESFELRACISSTSIQSCSEKKIGKVRKVKENIVVSPSLLGLQKIENLVLLLIIINGIFIT